MGAVKWIIKYGLALHFWRIQRMGKDGITQMITNNVRSRPAAPTHGAYLARVNLLTSQAMGLIQSLHAGSRLKEMA